MYYKFICVVIFTLIALGNSDAKRSRKNKHVNTENEESTPQPSVLTYSTFGFNDVGSYDGFIPSSPDYANYLTTHGKDTPSRIYAPAFPSSPDSSFPTNYETQITDQQMSLSNFPPAPIDFFTSPSSDFNKPNENEASNIYVSNGEELNSPAYGAKLSTKHRNKPYSEFNRTNINVFGNISPIVLAEATIEKNPQVVPTAHDIKLAFDESRITKQNLYKQPINSQTKDNGSEFKIPNSVSTNPLHFPRVVDFTNLKENYPISINNNKFLENSQKQDISYGNDNVRPTFNNFRATQPYKVKEDYEDENYKVLHEKDTPKTNSVQYQGSSDNPIHIKNNINSNKLDVEYRDKLKNRPWMYSNFVDENNKHKNTVNGYQYSTNHSRTTFKYDYMPHKTQFNSSLDEIAPASSNQVYPSYQLPETDFSDFDKFPGIKAQYDPDSNDIFTSNYYNNQKKPDEYSTQLKYTHTTEPIISSHWGNIFKTTENSQYKNNAWKPQFHEDNNDDIVHIPRKPQNQKYVRQYEGFSDDWSNNYRHHKVKPQYEWADNIKSRFKSEEDLLGLRTHDTSRPHYSGDHYRPNSYSDLAEEYEFKKLVNKWRQNYIKSKQKDSLHEYESYASDHKPVHVPMPHPYHIEVPHPVLVPVPQPYPVKVPIPKPVAVPIIRELSVPIEKPVPYPVYKKVPYPIEKPVPVPVEKQVPVPVVKPYPVAIPQIKPIFHHTKSHDDDEAESDEEYISRPEKKPYTKKTKSSTRNRSRSPPPTRRPSRMTYQDRNRKRLNPRPAASSSDYRYSRRPNRDRRPPYKYREDFEEDEYEASEYYLYCKRTGKC